MRNKRADISVMILVIGIVGVFILAILSFVKISSEISNDFSGIGLIETMNSLNVENNFYEETNFKGDYGNLFEGNKIKIIMKNGNMEGSYFLKKQNWMRSCEGNSFAWHEKCTKVIVRIDYEK